MLLDIGEFPIELDLILDGYPGPWREIQSLRHRSGWLMVSEARMVMPFGTWRRQLCAGVTDHEEVLSPWLAGKLLTLPVTSMRDAEHMPPDALDEIMDALYWDFLGSSDLKNLRYLEEEADRQSDVLKGFEARCLALIEKIELRIRDHRRELRQGVDDVRRAEIQARLTRLSAMTDELTRALRQKADTIRAETDALENLVLSGLTDFGEVEHRFTVRWRARTLRTGRRVRFPLEQEEPYSAEAWRNRVQSGISTANTMEDLAAIRGLQQE